MADALSLLRQFLINKKEFHEEDDKIIFGDVYYPKDVKTNYLIYGSGQNGQAKDYYSLECIIYLLKNTEISHANYIKNATSKKISVVSRPDRKDLLGYLYGETSVNTNVDKNAPIEITMQCPLPLPRSTSTNLPTTTTSTTSSSLNTISSNINNNIISANNTNSSNFESLLSTNLQPGTTLSSIIQSNSIPVSSSIGSTNLTSDQLYKKQHKNDDMISSDNKTNFKERITKKIESTSNAPRINENLTVDLSEKLTVEKLASIKAKIYAKKRKEIDNFDKDDDLQVSDQSAVKRLNQTVTGTGDSIITDTTNIDLTKEILNRERVWRNRITILDSSGKQFDKNIFAILQLIKIKEEGSLNNDLGASINLGPGTATSAIGSVNNGSGILNAANNSINSTSNSIMPFNNQQTANLLQQEKSTGSRSLAYSRFNQEKYSSKNETGGFSIDTKRSYQYNDAITLSTDSTTPSSSTQSNVNKMTQLNKTNLASIKNMPITSTSQKRTHMKPIIVVPAARTALITLFNAIDILQDLKYVSSDEKRKTLQNQNKDSEIIMHRREDGKTMQFKVIDNISKLNNEDWDRVVAVFAQGPLWQFKEWPWDGNPTEIFTKVKAFHLKWHGINLDSNISKWSVTVIELDQHRRHLDRAKLLAFWDELDKFMLKNKPHLCI